MTCIFLEIYQQNNRYQAVPADGNDRLNIPDSAVVLDTKQPAVRLTAFVSRNRK